MKKILGFFLIMIAIIFLSGCAQKVSQNDSQPQVNGVSDIQSTLVLFVGEGCPHCANVEEFMEENGIAEKISIETREVYYNKNNQKIFQEKAIECGMDTNRLGVPMMWDGDEGACHSGDVDIIDALKQKAQK